MKRRIIAALMCLCMLVGLLPTTALATPDKNTSKASTVSAKFYYIYNNTIPNPPETGSNSDQYGPSGNNQPFITVQIDMEKLFDEVGQNKGKDAEKTARDNWWVKDGRLGKEHGYVTAVSCSYKDKDTGEIDYAGWWKLVVSCMDEAGKKYFENNSFGKLFQGYVIKSVQYDGWQYHCDGIVTEPPPVYFAELYDGDRHVETLTAKQPQGNTVSNIQQSFTSYLQQQKYGDGQVIWQNNQNGVFKTNSGASYKISLTYDPDLAGNNLAYTGIVENYHVAKITMTVTECYTVTYDANGGTGSVPTDNETYFAGDSVTVKFDHTLTRPGYTFLGWSDNKDATTAIYTNTSTGTKQFTIQTNTTLYAIWKANDPVLSVKKTAALVNAAGNGTTPLGENDKVTVGDTIRYKVTVSNNGGPAKNVQVSDSKFPSDDTSVTVTPTGSASRNENGYYTIDSLGVDSSVTFAYDYMVTSDDAKAGSVENIATVNNDKTATSTVPVYQVKGVNKEVLTSVPQDVTAPQNLANFIQVGGQPTVLIHANAKQVALLYKITVTGTQGATFTVEDNGAVFWGGSAWNGTGTGTIGSSGTYELYCYKTFDKGSAWGTSLINTATVLGHTDTETTPVVTFAKDDDGHHSEYTLYYHPNFGRDQKANESTNKNEVVVQYYERLNILPEREGYTFVSWNTKKDGSGTSYLPGAVFKLTATENHLYAQWQKDKTGPDDSGVSNWLETDEHNAYLTGYPDSTFRADRNMTRAEVAQMFYALLLDKNVTITKSFSDVPDDAWYATAVKTLASLGMMDGYPDGTFRPDEPITRAEFATVGLAFAYDPLDASCSYYDVSASAWYHTYVAQATTYGWIGGYPDNTFRPGNNITRVEVCVIVNNMLGRDADERYIDRHEDELVHFVDLSDSYWGYYTIMEATNTHEYTGSFTNEKWTDVK